MHLLKNLLGFALLAAAIFLFARVGGWYTQRGTVVEAQRSVIKKIEELDGDYYYDFQLLNAGTDDERIADKDDPDVSVHWLSSRFGLDWFHDVFYVTFAQFDGVPKDGAQKAAVRGEIGDNQIAALTELPALKWVALNGTAVTDTGISLLAKSLPLERMWLGQTRLTDAGIQSLSTCTTLSHLAIEATPTSDRGLAFVTTLPNLISLSVGSPFITQDGLRSLRKLSGLKKLYLDRSPVDATVLSSLGSLTELRELSLRFTIADDRGVAALSGLNHLKFIQLSGSLVTDDGLNVAGQWPELQVAALANLQLTDAGLMHLADCKQLKSLDIAGTECTLGGVIQLFVEKQGRSLSNALQTVFECRVDANDAVISLDLSPLRIKDEDLELLRPLKAIQWLTLSNSLLTDLGAKALAEAGFERLSLLKLDGSQITDRGLVELLQISSLRDLHVAGTAITQEAVDRAKEQRPSLTIYRGSLR